MHGVRDWPYKTRLAKVGFFGKGAAGDHKGPPIHSTPHSPLLYHAPALQTVLPANVGADADNIECVHGHEHV